MIMGVLEGLFWIILGTWLLVRWVRNERAYQEWARQRDRENNRSEWNRYDDSH